MKLCRWFSIIAAIMAYDGCWTSWKHLLSWLAENLAGSSKECRKIQTRVAKELHSVATHDSDLTSKAYKKQLYKIKRAAGNTLRMAPHLLTDRNRLNTRLLLLVGVSLQSWMLLLCEHKVTAGAHAAMLVELACGDLEKQARFVWHRAFRSSKELERCGVKTLEGQVLEVGSSEVL